MLNTIKIWFVMKKFKVNKSQAQTLIKLKAELDALAKENKKGR
jgi:hypothetical protein